jgi:hypothetical protein
MSRLAPGVTYLLKKTGPILAEVKESAATSRQGCAAGQMEGKTGVRVTFPWEKLRLESVSAETLL